MAQGCSLIEKSRGNYTVLCEGHMATHRSKAIATLQFNVHLSFLVVLITGVYSIVANKFELPGEYLNYKPLNADLQQLNEQTQFALDSDDEAVEEENALKPKEIQFQPKSGVNGFGDH
ncbi:plant viral-response family protein [Thalictrum thalictroides]|uniref:Plant viral-response family protein n=1 Tax=Thalictrum thalictroides TaxID=46969 RepID=A0A7J6WG61_THATH|nr:plant viral-response family protein [Thalictrum thalictroides]